MLIKLVEVQRSMRGGTASLNEIYVNSSHIISISEDMRARESLVKEAKRLGLLDGARFSKITISEGNHTRSLTVVGTPAEVNNKIKKRQILRG